MTAVFPKSDRVRFSWSAWANRQAAAGPESVASFLVLCPCGGFQRLIGDLEGKDVFISLLTSHHNVHHVIHPFVRWMVNVLILVDVERAQAEFDLRRLLEAARHALSVLKLCPSYPRKLSGESV